jgi:hypothetical protein
MKPTVGTRITFCSNTSGVTVGNRGEGKKEYGGLSRPLLRGSKRAAKGGGVPSTVLT